MKAIKFNAIQKLICGEGFISPDGLREIYGFLKQFDIDDKYQFSDIEWVWMTKEGSLTKRLASHLYKLRNVKLAPEQLTSLGNICKKFSTERREVMVEFDKEFRWCKGDFADGDSCLFNDDRKYAFSILRDIQVFAMKVFTCSPVPPKSPKHWKKFYDFEPMGRCFIWKYKEDEYFIFNGYGGGRDTRYFAQLFASMYGFDTITPGNMSANNGFIYVNPSVQVVSNGKPSATSISLPKAKPGIEEDIRTRICKSCCDVLVIEDEHVEVKNYHLKCIYNCPRCGKRQAEDEIKKNHDACISCHYGKFRCIQCQRQCNGKPIVIPFTKKFPGEKRKIAKMCFSCYAITKIVKKCTGCAEPYLECTTGLYCPSCTTRINRSSTETDFVDEEENEEDDD